MGRNVTYGTAAQTTEKYLLMEKVVIKLHRKLRTLDCYYKIPKDASISTQGTDLKHSREMCSGVN